MKGNCYLLVISPYEKNGKRFITLPSPTLLAWFRSMWGKPVDDIFARAGGELYGMEAFFETIIHKNLPAPDSEQKLVNLLNELVYAEEALEVEDHFVHVKTHDDKNKIEYFIFDEVFLEKPEATTRLPSGDVLENFVDDDRWDDDPEDEIEESAEDHYQAIINRFTI